MTANSLTKVSLTQRIAKNTARRPMVKLTTMKTNVPMTLQASDVSIDRAVQRDARR